MGNEITQRQASGGRLTTLKSSDAVWRALTVGPSSTVEELAGSPMRGEIVAAIPEMEALLAPMVRGGVQELSKNFIPQWPDRIAEAKLPHFWVPYEKVLGVYPMWVLERAWMKHIEASVFWPKVAELKALCEEIISPARTAWSRAKRLEQMPVPKKVDPVDAETAKAQVAELLSQIRAMKPD